MSCSRCNQNNCSCGPRPYYETMDMCPEDNCEKIYQQQFYFSMQVQNSWNIPQVGGSATLNIPGLVTAELGTYIFNPNFGYFQIISIDVCNQQITVQNNGDATNQPVGTQVPECTGFILTDARCCEGGGGGTDCLNSVAVDFTAPAEDVPLTITVTSASGLSVGKIVQIGSGTYELTSIESNTTIVITNIGSGITPGTPVIAKDAAGNYLYCVIQLDQNPCTNDSVTEGTLMVCSEGIMRPLCGSVEGSIPILIDAENCTVQFQPSNFPPRQCTNLAADLVLFNGIAGPYTMVVVDDSGFTVGDVLQIGERIDRFTISGLPGSNFVEGDLNVAPGANEIIPSGTAVCTVTCCESLQDQIDDLEGLEEAQCVPQVTVGDIPLAIGGAFEVTVTLDEQGYFAHTVSTNLKEITLPDNDCQYAVIAHASIATVSDFAFEGEEAPPVGVLYQEIQLKWDTGNFPAGDVAGKLVWTENCSDFRTASMPTTSEPATFTQLTPPVNLPVMYHQADVETLSLADGGDVLQLELYYRTFAGENLTLDSFSSIRFMISGWVEIYRRN